MTEELVTLETAKVLKEKGFKEDIFTFYELDCVEGDMILSETYDYSDNFNKKDDCFSAPSQYLAQKWLRETKNLHIEISYMYENYWIYDILTIPNHDLVGLSDRPIIHYKSYEEALEAGLQEALKLI